MAKKQTRRSINLKAEAYDRLNAFCTKHRLSKSGVVEELVAASFEKRQPDLPSPPRKRKRKKDSTLAKPVGSGVNFL